MALQWTSGDVPGFSPTLPVRVGATRTRDNLTPVSVAFTVEFDYNPDASPSPSDGEVLDWLQPMVDAMKAAGWVFHTLAQDAPGAVRAIEEVA